MKSRLSQIFLLMGVIIAFAPIFAVDFILDNNLRNQFTQRYNESVSSISEQNQNAVFSAIDSLNSILLASPSLCTPTFVTNAQKQLQLNSSLSQIVVENSDGVQYCDSYNDVVKYSFLSEKLPIAGTKEILAIVQIADFSTPSIKVTKFIGSNRSISAFVHIQANMAGVIPNYLLKNTSMKISLTNGTLIIAKGKHFPSENTKQMIFSSIITNNLPISVELAVPFDDIKIAYKQMNVAVTIVVALLGIIIFLFILKSFRNAKMPAIDLEKALELGEFVPYYQPILNINTGKLIGCEVLMRWIKPNGEVVAPGMFIDYAESSGIAFPMTISLMKQVVKDLSKLCIDQPELKIEINLFEGHFRDTVIVEDIKTIFGNSDIKYSQLVFEITERRPLKNKLAVDSVIGGLQALGCKIAMDDAGTGHSNLAYMQTLGVDIIKIDRVFVDMIRPDSTNVPILDGLVSIAKDIGAEIVAEGVETQEQVRYLRQIGVVEVQGFLFSPAINPTDYIKLAKELNLSSIIDVQEQKVAA